MKIVCLAFLCVAASSCATGMKRESACLANLVPASFKAEEAFDAGRRADDAGTQEEARLRLVALRDWRDRVYKRKRLLTRLEEDHILSQTFFTLLAGPGIVFYPIIRWNVRSVLWDGADPDADSDPITQYYTERLASLGTGDG
jgi:hypothetical protein